MRGEATKQAQISNKRKKKKDLNYKFRSGISDFKNVTIFMKCSSLAYLKQPEHAVPHTSVSIQWITSAAKY